MSNPLDDLKAAGVSIWLDDLSRERLETGSLAQMTDQRNVTGVTTNPTIFAGALSNGERYRAQVSTLASSGADVAETIEQLTCSDVQAACDVLAGVHAQTNGADGFVSIEVPPALARDTDGTVAAALRLAEAIDRPNLLIKIPATTEGLPAIAAVTAAGISVNVTLIFSVERYREVMDAYLYGLEQAAAEGRDLSKIHSVASFFVSRVDSAVDPLLGEHPQLRGKTAIANAVIAHAAFREVFGSDRAKELLATGANAQRPLWASTGVKDPAYPDTLYVSELVVAGSVNTMPEATLEAFADHGEVRGDTVTDAVAEAEQTMSALARAGVDFKKILDDLETEGIEKFNSSWADLENTVRELLRES